jgi:hypothetical protein
MITALINRMLITISRSVESPQKVEASGRGPFGQLDTPFEVLPLAYDEDPEYPLGSFMDLTAISKGEV